MFEIELRKSIHYGCDRRCGETHDSVMLCTPEFAVHKLPEPWTALAFGDLALPRPLEGQITYGTSLCLNDSSGNPGDASRGSILRYPNRAVAIDSNGAGLCEAIAGLRHGAEAGLAAVCAVWLHAGDLVAGNPGSVVVIVGDTKRRGQQAIGGAQLRPLPY